MSEPFVSVLSLLLQDSLFNGFAFNKVTRAQHGVANEVYCLEFREAKFILKLYKDIFDSRTADFLIDVCKQNGINVPRVLKQGVYADRKYILMEFAEGRHMYEMADKNISQIVNLVTKLPTRDVAGICENTIYRKTDLYCSFLKGLRETRLPCKYIDDVIAKYESVICGMDKENLFIVHGDISPTNLLWSGENLTAILDFDEAVLAPAEYDLIVAVIKFCKVASILNVDLAKKMIRQYIETNQLSDANALRSTWYLYISKVLLEKFYLHESAVIDLYDERQLKDDWRAWYELMNNEDMCKVVFEGIVTNNSVLHKIKSIRNKSCSLEDNFAIEEKSGLLC